VVRASSALIGCDGRGCELGTVGVHSVRSVDKEAARSLSRSEARWDGD